MCLKKECAKEPIIRQLRNKPWFNRFVLLVIIFLALIEHLIDYLIYSSNHLIDCEHTILRPLAIIHYNSRILTIIIICNLRPAIASGINHCFTALDLAIRVCQRLRVDAVCERFGAGTICPNFRTDSICASLRTYSICSSYRTDTICLSFRTGTIRRCIRINSICDCLNSESIITSDLPA